MLNYLIPFIILILIVVFIHEYGHYYFAKKYGVGVTDFSIGFGQEIFGWNDKSGTRWKICWRLISFFSNRKLILLNINYLTDLPSIHSPLNVFPEYEIYSPCPCLLKAFISPVYLPFEYLHILIFGSLVFSQ